MELSPTVSSIELSILSRLSIGSAQIVNFLVPLNFALIVYSPAIVVVALAFCSCSGIKVH